VFEEWWDILLLLCYKFIAKSVSERILKIGQYLAKMEAKIEWHLFFCTQCMFPIYCQHHDIGAMT